MSKNPEIRHRWFETVDVSTIILIDIVIVFIIFIVI